MLKQSLIVGLSTSAAYLLLGCVTGPSPQSTCSENADCPAGLVCQIAPAFFAWSSECVHPPASLGQPCVTDNVNSCESDLECAPDNGVPSVAFGTARRTTAESVPAYWQPTGDCFVYEVGFPEICRAAGERAEGEGCFSDRVCAAGLICNEGYLPIPVCSPLGQVGDPCLFDEDCGVGLHCESVELTEPSCSDATPGSSPWCSRPVGCDLESDSRCQVWAACGHECRPALEPGDTSPAFDAGGF